MVRSDPPTPGPDPRVFLTFDDRASDAETRTLVQTPVFSAVLSALVMGAGQIYNGQARRGLVFFLAQLSLMLYGWDHLRGRVVSEALISWVGPVLYGFFIGTLFVGGVVVWLFNVYDAYEVARFVAFIFDRHSQLLDDEEEAERGFLRESEAGRRRGRMRQASFVAAVVLLYTLAIFTLGSRMGRDREGIEGLLTRLATSQSPELHLNAARFFFNLQRYPEARLEYERAHQFARTAYQKRAAELGLTRLQDVLQGGEAIPPEEPAVGPGPAAGPVDWSSPGPEVVGPGSGSQPSPLDLPPVPEPGEIRATQVVDLDREYALERAELELGTGNHEAAAQALAPLGEQGPQSGRLEWIRGEIARLRGDRAGARARFEKAARLAPRDPRPLLGLAELAREEGTGGLVEVHLRQAATVAPEDRDAVRAYSDHLLSEGRAEEAHDVVAKALTARPGDSDLLYRSFVLSRQAGNSERAHEAALALAKVEYRDGEVYAFLARRALARNRLDDADRFVATLERVDRAHPSSLLLKAEVLRRRGRNREVVDLLAPAVRGGSLELAMLLAEAAKDVRDYRPGIEALEAAQRIHPPSAPAMKLLGILKKRAGDLSGALEAYLKALAVDPGDKEALYLAGYVYYRTGQYRLGIETLEKVHAKEAGYGETDFYLGVCYQGVGEAGRSREALARVLSTSPNYGKARQILEEMEAGASEPPTSRPVADPGRTGTPAATASPVGSAPPPASPGAEEFPAPRPPPPSEVSVERYADRLRDAEIAFRDRDFGEALRLYDAVLQVKPDHFRSHLQKGLALLELGRREEALDALQLARAVEPGDLRTLTEIGQLLVELERERPAIAILEEALRLDPKNLAVRYKLGVLYERQEGFAKAEEQYQAILWYHPEYVRAQEYLGNVQFKQRRYDRASVAFRALLARFPEDHTVRFKLALTLLQLDDTAGAKAELDKLAESLPADHALRAQVEHYRGGLGRDR